MSSIQRNNPRFKRHLRDQRRLTGIRPTDVSLASTSTEDSANEDEEEHRSTEFNDLSGTLTPSIPQKSTYSVNRIQSSLEHLSIPDTDLSIKTSLSNSIFRSTDICLHRQTRDNDDSSTIETQQLEERIRTLESLVDEKDLLIEDLHEKLNKLTRNLHDAEDQISRLHQEKLTLLKALTTIQESKRSSNIFVRN